MSEDRRTAATIREALEREIIAGRFAPGDRLDEASLARRFSVSRTPVREALLGLESSGLLEHRPRRGAFVRSAGVRELVEMFETMAELEASCAAFASRRIARVEERKLGDYLARCEAAADGGDAEHYYVENEKFHAAIYAASGNRFLEGQALALQARLKPFRRHQLWARGRIAESLDEHRAIVHAIRSGDAHAASDTARNHVVIQGEKFMALVACLEGVPAE